MQIVRTIVWVLLLVALVVFSVANWEPTVTVKIWQGLVVDTKIPAIVIVSFVIGWVPMWLYARAAKWQADRRIKSLENSVQAAAVVAPVVSDLQHDGVLAPDAHDDGPGVPEPDPR